MQSDSEYQPSEQSDSPSESYSVTEISSENTPEQEPSTKEILSCDSFSALAPIEEVESEEEADESDEYHMQNVLQWKISVLDHCYKLGGIDQGRADQNLFFIFAWDAIQWMKQRAASLDDFEFVDNLLNLWGYFEHIGKNIYPGGILMVISNEIIVSDAVQPKKYEVIPMNPCYCALDDETKKAIRTQTHKLYNVQARKQWQYDGRPMAEFKPMYWPDDLE